MAEGEENDCKRREKGTGARVSAVEKRETQARVSVGGCFRRKLAKNNSRLGI